MKKKVAVGVVSHRTLQVETPDEVAEDIRYALNHIDAENLVLTSDCGFGRQGSNRLVAFYKTAAIVQGANIVRRELGLSEGPVRAADPVLQIDAPAPRRSPDG
jgi:5-methyltetrahydropteroyltriglutamate--homocysteine methyltransferase